MGLNVNLVNTGLTLSLVGTFLIFVYGLSPLLPRSGAQYLSVGESEYLKRKAKLYDILSRLGILSIVAGFVFQLIGNHIVWSVSVDTTTLCSSLVFGVIIIATTLLIKHCRKRRYDLRACYHPQFDKSKPSYSHEHMWVFIITNNSKKIIRTAALHLKSNASTAIIYYSGKPPEVVNDSKNIDLKKIQVGESVRIHAWNIGGCITDGHDCHLSIKDKVVRPKVCFFE